MTGRIPDFFIVGVAKCGTSALFDYLSAHPSVFTGMKEPSFFCAEFDIPGATRTLDDYLALFANAPACALTGEASVNYFFSESAISKIIAMNPQAKIIVMLRHPVEAARSLHMHHLRVLDEDIEDFEEAWRAQPERAQGGRLPQKCNLPWRLQYGNLYRYGERLKRVTAVVPPKQLHVLIFEEFFGDPAKNYAGVQSFLGLPPDGRLDFPAVNPALRNRSRILARFLIHMPAIVKQTWGRVRRLAHPIGLHPNVILTTLNTTPIKKIPLTPGFRAELERFFADDIAEVERLLGRHLEHWH